MDRKLVVKQEGLNKQTHPAKAGVPQSGVLENIRNTSFQVLEGELIC